VKPRYHSAGTTRQFSAAGDYNVSLTSVAGCDSIATLHLVVNPVVTGEETITVCEVPYHIAGTNQSLTAAVITQHIDKCCGCDSIATLHLVLIQW
jgi:hypothetical protein